MYMDVHYVVSEFLYRKFQKKQWAEVQWCMRADELPDRCGAAAVQVGDHELILDVSGNYEAVLDLKSIRRKCQVC